MNIHMSALVWGLVTGALLMAQFAVYRRQNYAGRRGHGPRDLRPVLVADAWALGFAILIAMIFREAMVTVAPGNPRWVVEGSGYLVVLLVAVAVVLAVVDGLSVWRSSREE
ncbi:hypothetical protein [Longimicrobium sp.]|jgi:hypothetical protein|uniref:hypothetical protein n=1 Tax=Longimicrobium sp. TaxID=2029185 RepID=UPI002F92A96D